MQWLTCINLISRYFVETRLDRHFEAYKEGGSKNIIGGVVCN